MENIEIYLGEIETQIEYAELSYFLFEKAHKESKISLMFMTIHHFLIHVSNVDKILDTRGKSLRHQILDNKFAAIDLKQFRGIRNHLEHFDERLDKWVKNHQGHAFFDMNLISGTKGFPDKIFLRALDGYIFKFYGESYDLLEIKTALEEVKVVLHKIQAK